MRPKGRSGSRRAAPCLLLALVAGGCAGPASNETGAPAATRSPEAAPVAVAVDDAGLWATTEGGRRQLLADDGKYYEARVSPDGRLIVADIALLSDLQVVRVYRRSRGSESWQPAADVTRTAWQRAAEAHDLALEEVSHARTRFVAWADDGAALELELSGRLPDGSELRYSQVVALERPVDE